MRKFPLMPNKNLSFLALVDHFCSACEFSQISIFINNKYKIAWVIHCLLTCYLETGLTANYGEIASLFRIDLFPLYLYFPSHCPQMDNLQIHLRLKRVIICHFLHNSNILSLMTIMSCRRDNCISVGGHPLLWNGEFSLIGAGARAWPMLASHWSSDLNEVLLLADGNSR